jgi:diaminopimelate decarboxylase
MIHSRIRGPFDRSLRTATKRAIVGIARRLSPERKDLALSTWRLSRDGAGVLALGATNLRDALQRWGSPLHLVDGEALARNAARFTARPSGARRGCEVFCSYKTNPVPGILGYLHARGLGAEVVSAHELWLALRLGVDPAAIVYNGPARSEDSLASAVRAGVGLINVNSRAEIARLALLSRNLGKTASVGIRVVVPGGLGGQFGERIDNGAALAAFGEALRYPELRVVGLHSHFNGRIDSPSQLDAILSALLGFADQLRAQHGLELRILDVGGNLACPTVSHLTSWDRRLAVSLGCEPRLRRPESELTIERYVAQVVGRVESHYLALGLPVPRIFMEPGRAMTSNTQMLLASVVGVREPDEMGIRWAVLDAGIHLAEPMANEWHQLFPISLLPGAPARLHRLTGPSCMLSDQMYPAWKLPELNAGDGLAIMDTGAYFVAFSSPFSAPRPAIVMVDAAGERLLRRAETSDDLVVLDGELGSEQARPGRRGDRARSPATAPGPRRSEAP